MRRCTVALALAFVSFTAGAQISGSASFVSNYRFRGVTLSENKPAAQLAVVYDDALGWYAGTFASTVEFADPTRREVQFVPFVGYAKRTASGTSWEVGADYSAFTGGASRYDYPEVYVGAAADSVSGRIYYSNRYFGQDSSSIYLEVNAAPVLFDRVRLLAHFGVLRASGGNPYYAPPEKVYDARLGVGVELDPLLIELSWVGINSASTGYGITQARSRNGPVLTLRLAF